MAIRVVNHNILMTVKTWVMFSFQLKKVHDVMPFFF